MHKLIFTLFFLCMLVGASGVSASSQNPYFAKYIKDHKPVGTGRLTYMFWDVYDATLYASGGKMEKGKPFALTLKYLRDIEGKDIAEVSAKEIKKQNVATEGDIADWQNQMEKIFPSVTKGSVLTGVYIPQKSTKFFYDGKLIGEIKDEKFSQSFFNIWLGPKSSKPQLRRSLMGL